MLLDSCRDEGIKSDCVLSVLIYEEKNIVLVGRDVINYDEDDLWY